MMQDELGRLIARAREWNAAGHRMVLATVVRTWGSSPRRAGSHLLVRDDGLFEGSVSGGCVEGDVVVAAEDVLASGRARLMDFGVADETAWRVGLGCGGQVAILVQRVDAGGFPFVLFDALAEARAHGRAFAITFDLAGGPAVAGDDPAPGRFVARHDPPRRLAIVGAVHIAQALAPIARLVGHAVTIVDPRGAFAAGPRFEGETVDTRWPDEALADWKPDAASAVVALTHDPKLDDPALAAALALGLPTVIHEQNAVLGRVNRLLAPRVDRIATSYAHVARLAPGLVAKVRFTGNPVRPEIVAIALPTPGPLDVLVLGGSQGASILSGVVPPALAALGRPMHVTQQCREADLVHVRAIYAQANIAADLAPYFQDVPSRLSSSNLVIARAGASTIAELTACGRASILVPLPGAMDDHQTANARALAEQGGAVLIPQRDFTAARLTAELLAMTPDRLALMAQAARNAGRPGAAAALANLILETV